MVAGATVTIEGAITVVEDAMVAIASATGTITSAAGVIADDALETMGARYSVAHVLKNVERASSSFYNAVKPQRRGGRLTGNSS